MWHVEGMRRNLFERKGGGSGVVVVEWMLVIESKRLK